MKRTVLLLALTTIVLTAQAQQVPGKAGREGSKDGKSMNVRVHRFGSNGFMIPGLSNEQKDEIKKLRLEMGKEVNSIRNQLAEKRARINTLKAQDKADMSAINKTIDEAAALQAQQIKAEVNFHVKVRALLNDEQKVAFDSHKSHCGFGYSMSNDMEQAKMRLFKLGDAVFGAPEGFELPEDFNPLFEQHFELKTED